MRWTEQNLSQYLLRSRKKMLLWENTCVLVCLWVIVVFSGTFSSCWENYIFASKTQQKVSQWGISLGHWQIYSQTLQCQCKLHATITIRLLSYLNSGKNAFLILLKHICSTTGMAYTFHGYGFSSWKIPFYFSLFIFWLLCAILHLVFCFLFLSFINCVWNFQSYGN